MRSPIGMSVKHHQYTNSTVLNLDPWMGRECHGDPVLMPGDCEVFGERNELGFNSSCTDYHTSGLSEAIYWLEFEYV